MKRESQGPPSERHDSMLDRGHRTARQMRWAIRGVLALALLLAAAWLLMLRR